jgi:hypothetical protein
VRIEVQDEGGPWTQASRDLSRGHGLDILHTLATDWGIDGDYRLRTFWAHLGGQATQASEPADPPSSPVPGEPPAESSGQPS